MWSTKKVLVSNYLLLSKYTYFHSNDLKDNIWLLIEQCPIVENAHVETTPMVEVSCLIIILNNILFSSFEYIYYILLPWQSNTGDRTTPMNGLIRKKLTSMHTPSSLVSIEKNRNSVQFYFILSIY